MFVRTERLFLRPGWPEDLEELLTLLGDESIVRSIGVAPLPTSVSELRDYLARPRESLMPHFFINLREDGAARVIGGIGLARSGAEVELGYWIAPAYRGRGYAAEAVRAVLGHARILGHRRIVAAHFAENAASARVLEQAGFVATGAVSARPSVGRGTEGAVQLYVAEFDDDDAIGADSAGDIQPFVAAAPRSSQAGASSGAMSSTRKWSTASPSAG